MGEIALQSSWGVLVALYLFLGGLAGGTALVTGVVRLKYGERFPRLVRFGAWASALLLICGVLCLLAETTMPLRAMQLWRAFTNPTSWMTIGAWLLVAGIAVFGLFELASTPAVTGALFRKKPETAAKLQKALAAIAAVLGACVALYTGILIGVLINHPLWNTPLIPVLFTVSAFDTGIALVCLYLALGKPADDTKEEQAKMTGLFEKCSVGLIAAEAVVLVVLLAMTNGAGTVGNLSVWALLAGPLALPFWLVLVVCGLAMPLVLELLQLRGNHAKWLTVAAPALILVGGLALRFLILYAGLPLSL